MPCHAIPHRPLLLLFLELIHNKLYFQWTKWLEFDIYPYEQPTSRWNDSIRDSSDSLTTILVFSYLPRSRIGRFQYFPTGNRAKNSANEQLQANEFSGTGCRCRCKKTLSRSFVSGTYSRSKQVVGLFVHDRVKCPLSRNF